jgi:hypothetical protein
MDSIDIEKYTIDRITYDLAIYEVEGGMNGKWACRLCGGKGGPKAVSASLAGAVGRVKGNLFAHHTQHLIGEPPVSEQ